MQGHLAVAGPSGGSRVWRFVRELGAVAFLVVLCTGLAIGVPGFRGIGNILNVLVQISSIAIGAAGMTFVIIAGGIDLSVGSVLALSGCAGTVVGLKLAQAGPEWLTAWGLNVPIGFAVGVAVGAVCGLANGLMITKIPLPPFIATLGLMGLARGLAYYVADSRPVEVVWGMRQIARARVLGVPFPIIVLVAVYALAWIVLRYTRVGRYSFAIGGNQEAARLSGVSVDLYKIIVYAATGALTAISGLIVAGRLAWMQPQEGDGFELDVIAAVVIGGTSLSGGEGSIVGTLLGALIMGTVRNGLDLKAVDYNLQKVVIGAIIILAVSVDVLAKRLGRRTT